MSADDIKPVLTDAQIVAAMRGADKAWNGLTDDEIIVNYGNEARAIERAAIQADRASRALSPQGDAGWMLIEEDAPIDVPMDTPVLLAWWDDWSDEWRIEANYAGSERGGWRHGRATHWMPLPDPPAARSTPKT